MLPTHRRGALICGRLEGGGSAAYVVQLVEIQQASMSLYCLGKDAEDVLAATISQLGQQGGSTMR